MKYTRVLLVLFDSPIMQHEIPLFRGAVIGSMQSQANTLFHNHLPEDKFRYSYPLIQYKRIKGKPAIVCIDTGTDVIGQFMAEPNTVMHLGDRIVEMNVENIQPRRMLIQTWDTYFYYNLRRWLPLNSKNYHLFQELESDEEKTEFLVRILKGNILSFAKGLGITIEHELEVEILDQPKIFQVKNKGVSLMAFDLAFKTNISLPNYIGLGKNASIGYGIIHRKINNKETVEEK